MLTTALEWIQQQQFYRIQELIEWAHINSGSTNLVGLARMHQTLSDAFSSLADTTQSLDCTPNTGNALYFQKRPALSNRILLCGHMDTVFPANSSFQQTHYLTPTRLVGPGVTDMKGGLMVMLLALQAFERTPEAKQIGWDVFINADEELGSLNSRLALERAAKKAKIGLVFEPTLDELGTLARARKGCGHFSLLANGKSAHSGRNFYAGNNAITLLSRALIDIDALNSAAASFTINIGLISGGDALNQVPEKACAKIEIRIEDPSQEDRLIEQIKAICHRLTSPHATLTFSGQFHRPVKKISPQTTQLFKVYQQVASSLALKREWKDTGGCCDGNNLAAMGLAVLDTLGVKGGAIHTEKEYIFLDSLSEQAALCCALLHRLASSAYYEVKA